MMPAARVTYYSYIYLLDSRAARHVKSCSSVKCAHYAYAKCGAQTMPNTNVLKPFVGYSNSHFFVGVGVRSSVCVVVRVSGCTCVCVKIAPIRLGATVRRQNRSQGCFWLH